MTKEKAYEELLENSRALVCPKFAEEIAKAFGQDLQTLNIMAMPTKTFYRANFSKETQDLNSVSINLLASRLVEKLTKQEAPRGIFHGEGRNAEWITEKSVEILKRELK